MVAKVNLTHTVGDLRNYIAAYVPHYPSCVNQTGPAVIYESLI